MKPIKFAIMGAGGIGRKMAKTILHMKEIQAYGVGARSRERAQQFADEFGFLKAYGSYEQLLADPEVELVYIGTPHSHHLDCAKMCLEAGKHVLCEKPLMVNAGQAEEIFRLAEQKGLLITEAMWPRYMPMAKTLNETCESGAIGKIHSVVANIGYNLANVPRLMDPALAGGALLDVGIYAINFAAMVLGDDLEILSSSRMLSERGIDLQNSMTLQNPQGQMAVLHSSILGWSDHQGLICGEQGYIVVDEITNFGSISVFDSEKRQIARYERPEQISGYEYEVQAAVKAIREGKRECPQMPHSTTLKTMKLMDALRKDWGVRYPFEG